MSPEEEEHEIFKNEELITVKMRVQDYRIMMEMIRRDESMHIVGKYIKTFMLGVAGVIGAYIIIIKFLKDQIIG